MGSTISPLLWTHQNLEKTSSRCTIYVRRNYGDVDWSELGSQKWSAWTPGLHYTFVQIDEYFDKTLVAYCRVCWGMFWLLVALGPVLVVVVLWNHCMAVYGL